MECAEFEAALAALGIDEIRAIAAALDASEATAAEEIAAMRATLAVEHALRRTNRQTQAALAARAMGAAVQAAARRDRIKLPDDAVTRVARAAGQVARALVAGETVITEAHLFADVFQTWPAFEEVPLFA
jgi:hypothetical protein